MFLLPRLTFQWKSFPSVSSPQPVWDLPIFPPGLEESTQKAPCTTAMYHYNACTAVLDLQLSSRAAFSLALLSGDELIVPEPGDCVSISCHTLQALPDGQDPGLSLPL